jgi:hypothetical protein
MSQQHNDYFFLTRHGARLHAAWDYSLAHYNSVTLDSFKAAWLLAAADPDPSNRREAQAEILHCSSWVRAACLDRSNGSYLDIYEEACHLHDYLLNRFLYGTRSFVPCSHFKAFWKTVFHNLRKDLQRRWLRGPVELEITPDMEVAASCVHNWLELTEDFPPQEKAFARAVLIARLSVAEAIEDLAKQFGVTERTMQRHAVKARKLLKQALE